MARKVKWSKWVLRDLGKIATYWDHRNESTSYSDRVTGELIRTVNLLLKMPFLGKRTFKKDTFLKIIAKHFLIVYRVSKEKITILRLTDTRRDPEKLKSYLSEK